MAVPCLLGLLAVHLASAADGPMGVERVARLTYAGYQSSAAGTNDDSRWVKGQPEWAGVPRVAGTTDALQWVQVDLGHSVPIDTIKLFPLVNWSATSAGFPARFKIEVADNPEFKTVKVISDHTTADYPKPNDEVSVFPGRGQTGRYVRLTVTRLYDAKLALTKLEVWSGGKDVAQGCPAADSLKGNLGKIDLTRAPRPQGDEVVTDNPGNVIPAAEWKPVFYQAQAPLGGVHLGDGLFKTAMQNNIAYLMNSFTFDELVREFRERAGKPNPAGLRAPNGFWETTLAGSNPGRFLMGAGNTLRWMEDAELRQRMDRIVDVIEECREPNGYLMAYPENTIFYSERAAYTRAWVTHGLIEAGFAGNPKAFPLLRGFYDWFDQNPYLPELLRRGGQGVQGTIANTRTYFTPVGKPEDLQVVQRYFQENYWLDELAKRQAKAIWQYPYSQPHNYLITALEPYLDLYRATGHRRYLDASLGGWELYHDNWEHIGGSISICEGFLANEAYPPHSNFLHLHTGELCGSVFWARFNQRFHLLYPDQEKYVNEIEKSIYNVTLPNQIGTNGICYHANLLGQKDMTQGISKNTCCEGQGTRMLGSLPEYLYSIAADGLYVDMFAPSDITWQQGRETLKAQMTTQFPFDNQVALRLSLAAPTKSKIRVRVPAWSARPMPILVNHKRVATGKPGTYATLKRVWKDGDTITFALPAELRLTKYHGAEASDTQPRYALEYGPILLAAVGDNAGLPEAQFAGGSAGFLKRLQPQAGQPLHFAITGEAHYSYLPSWEVGLDQTFTCFPIFGAKKAAN